MPDTTLKCEYDSCTWVSEPAGVDTCLRLLEIHVDAKHAKPKSAIKTSAVAKPEKAKRPELPAEVSDEDWAYFICRWGDYKKSTSLVGEEIVLQLMECCTEQLRREHHRTFPR